MKLLDELDEADWDRLMAINVKSIYLSIKYGLAHLKRNARSYVVNIGSISSFVGQGGTPAYTASKGAVLMLSKSIALDYAADGLRCNCVCPGITDTPMLREHLNKTPDPTPRWPPACGACRWALRLRRPTSRKRLSTSVAKIRRASPALAGRRRRLSGRRRVATSGPHTIYGPVNMPQINSRTRSETIGMATGERGLHVSAVAARQRARPDRALELDGIDIGLFEGRSHLWPSREFKELSRSAKVLRDKLSDRGLQPADVFLQLDPDFVPYAINQPDAGRRQHAREQFLRTLEYASELGSPHVTTLPGVYFENDESAADSWQRSQDELAWRVEQAKNAQHHLLGRSPRRLARPQSSAKPSEWSAAFPASR